MKLKKKKKICANPAASRGAPVRLRVCLQTIDGKALPCVLTFHFD